MCSLVRVTSSIFIFHKPGSHFLIVRWRCCSLSSLHWSHYLCHFSGNNKFVNGWFQASVWPSLGEGLIWIPHCGESSVTIILLTFPRMHGSSEIHRKKKILWRVINDYVLKWHNIKRKKNNPQRLLQNKTSLSHDWNQLWNLPRDPCQVTLQYNLAYA